MRSDFGPCIKCYMTHQELVEAFCTHLRSLGCHAMDDPVISVEGEKILIDGTMPLGAVRVLADLLDKYKQDA